jgi:MFS family permease
LTIARGTVPLALFGPLRYGERTGLIGAPARVAQAFAPLIFGLLLDRLGVAAIAVSAALCLAALAALLCLGMKASASGAE